MNSVPHGIMTRPVAPVFSAWSVFGALFCLFAIFALWAPFAQAASVATVDQADGYSGKVLEKITRSWHVPLLKENRKVSLQISLDGQGNVLECKLLKASGSKELDNSVCNAFRDASPFGTPPYGVPVETYFTFWTGDGKQASASQAPAATEEANKQAAELAASIAPGPAAHAVVAPNAANPAYQKYLSGVTKKIRQSIYIPVETKTGTYHVTARIKCDKNGKILSWSILKSSGDERLDKYVLQGIKRAQSVTPPPKGLGDTLDLAFTLTRM